MDNKDSKQPEQPDPLRLLGRRLGPEAVEDLLKFFSAQLSDMVKATVAASADSEQVLRNRASKAEYLSYLVGRFEWLKKNP